MGLAVAAAYASGIRDVPWATNERQTMIRFSKTHRLTLAALAALTLAACDRNDERTVGQQIDQAVASAERKTDQVQAEASRELAAAKASTERAADKMAQAADNATDKVGDAIADAAVTASINAELAKDPKLSALRIDVDTENGAVLLTGQAPDAESRDRATQLAQSVKGVTRVENRLQIGG